MSSHINSWLFQTKGNKRNRKHEKVPDPLSAEKRNLLNDHLDGILTGDQLREKLLELKSNGEN